MNELLILFYNTMWGQPLHVPDDLPKGFQFSTDRRRYAEASAVVFHVPELRGYRRLLMPRKPPGQLWVAWSMECDENYRAMRDPRFLRRFDLTMTYRLDSDVPVTYVGYYSSAENLAQSLRQPPRPKLSEPLASLFMSSRIDRIGRRRYARELASYLAIDSYGKFMRNKTLPTDQGRPSKLETIASYKFAISFENASARDYVTEKFFDPLVAGSLPVYLGAPNIEDFAPGDHCFVNVADFPDPRSLAEYLKALAADEAGYQSYFAWKQQPYRARFQDLLRLSTRHPFARLGELVYTRLRAR